jgi:methionine-rich copper-binding protein CopC
MLLATIATLLHFMLVPSFTALPAMGSTIPTPPGMVTVHFNDSIYPSPATTYVQVYGPGGAEISVGDCSYPDGHTMRIPIQADGTGVYVVHWYALFDNLQTSDAAYTFTVEPYSNILLPYLPYAMLVLVLVLLFSLRPVLGKRLVHMT